MTVGSPQSTLCGLPKSGQESPNGGASQVSSPPSSPLEQKPADPWDMLYEAAGQVARMRVTNSIPVPNNPYGFPAHGGFAAPARKASPLPPVSPPATKVAPAAYYHPLAQLLTQRQIQAAQVLGSCRDSSVAPSFSAVFSPRHFSPVSVSSPQAAAAAEVAEGSASRRGRRVGREADGSGEDRRVRSRRVACRHEPCGVASLAEAAARAGTRSRGWRRRRHARRVPHPARRQARAQRHRRLPPSPGRRTGGAQEKDRCSVRHFWPFAFAGVFPCSFGSIFFPFGVFRDPAGCSTVLVPARVVQALNLNLDDLGAQPRYPGGFVLDHGNHHMRRNPLFSTEMASKSLCRVVFFYADALINRSNAMLASQKRRASPAVPSPAPAPALCHSS